MRLTVATLLFSAAILASGCGGDQEGSPPEPSEIVAEVNGRTLLVRDVVDHLSPPDPAMDIGAPVNPRRQALDAAIRVDLFAREAQRRGMKVPEGPPQIAKSQLVQSVIRQELRDLEVPSEGSVARAQSFYEERPELFNGDRVVSVSLSALVVEDAKTAERLSDQADGISDDGFTTLVNEHSVDAATRSNEGRFTTLVHGGKGPAVDQGDKLDAELSAVGWSLRRPGQVGLARDSGGRYYVLRAEKVDIAVRTLDEELMNHVEGVVEIERREHALQQTEVELRENADISVDEAILYSIPVPA